MNYGHFDSDSREYVVTRPDTPTAWSNYMGTRLFGGIITNNAGGYGFTRSPASGRILRMQYNAIPMDQPGRYFYIRDNRDGDYWSASWQPVGKPLDAFESTCRFGTGYTIIESRYRGIASEATYFVPRGKDFEYWRLTLKNDSDETRRLSVFTYCEFSSEWSMPNDLLNLQYTAYTAKAEMRDGFVRLSSNDHLPQRENFADRDQGRWAWMTLLGSPVTGWQLDREEFLGPYRTYADPQTVEQGRCGNAEAYGGNPCGSLQTDIELAPGESREVLVMLGVGKVEEAGKATAAEFGTSEQCEKQLQSLKAYWHGYLDNAVCRTPDDAFDHMTNTWGAYNTLMTYEWSRSCSLVYTGQGRDGFGYRDTVQDMVGAVGLMGEDIRERLELMLTGQRSSGGAQPLVDPVTHRPGSGSDEPAYRSDDCLWLFNAVPEYVAETGDVAFYDKTLPYYDTGEATVFQHLRRALEFNLERRGEHNLPCGLLADWNDCLEFGPRGETLFVAFQLRYGLVKLQEIAEQLGRAQDAQWATQQLADVDAALDAHGWDGEWFVRGYREDRSVLGSASCEEGKIFLNAQSWAVLSGYAAGEQAAQAMAAADKHLASDYGMCVCNPPYVKESVQVVRAVLMNPGQKENAAIFSHPQGWAVMADCLLGEGDRAWKHYRSYMPAAQNDRIEVRQIEPFVHCQSTESPASKHYGRSHIPWLSGTAAWSYYTATHYILGIRPELGGLRIDPCIPSQWEGFEATRVFRGKRVHIRVSNPDKLCRGVASLRIDGKAIDGSLAPLDAINDGSCIEVTLSE